MPKGIVVDHKESGVRYAISEKNFNDSVHTLVRDLLPGETVLSFQPKSRRSRAEEPEAEGPYDYSDPEWTVAELQKEIDGRNEEREEGDVITPDSGKKADLIAALMHDDETEDEGDSTSE